MTLSTINRNAYLSTKRSWLSLGLIVSALMSCSTQVFKDEPQQQKRSGTVFILDGSKQCQSAVKSVTHFENLLQREDVNVSQPRCGQITGTFYPTVCGAQNGKVYWFDVDDVDMAKVLGFVAIAELPEGQGIVEKPCPPIETSTNTKA